MKRTVCMITLMVIALTLVACGAAPAQTAVPTADAATPSPTAAPSTPSAQAETVKFTDAALEAKVRAAMNKPAGDITVQEAKAVVKLDLSNKSFDDMNSKNGGVRDISSLKYFTGLQELNLSFNDIKDFTPLSELTSLTSLNFTGVRPDDLSQLKSLTNMACLVFDWCYSPDQGYTACSNIDFIADMKNLEVFEAKGAGIKDITVLGTLPKLWSVFLDENQITDITPLTNLKNLKELLLSKNSIKDFSPLKDIYGNLQAKDFEIK